MALTEAQIDALVTTAAQSPKQVVSGSRSVTQHDPDKIASLLNQSAATSAANTTGFGLRFTKLIPGPGG